MKIEAAHRLVAIAQKREVREMFEKISDALEKLGVEVDETHYKNETYLSINKEDSSLFPRAMQALGLKSIGLPKDGNFVWHNVGYDLYVQGHRAKADFCIYVTMENR